MGANAWGVYTKATNCAITTPSTYLSSLLHCLLTFFFFFYLKIIYFNSLLSFILSILMIFLYYVIFQTFDSNPARLWLKDILSSSATMDQDPSLSCLMVDSFRHFYPDKEKAFTCWNTSVNARQSNSGTRIDYILITTDIIPFLQDSIVMQVCSCSTVVRFLWNWRRWFGVRFQFSPYYLVNGCQILY